MSRISSMESRVSLRRLGTTVSQEPVSPLPMHSSDTLRRCGQLGSDQRFLSLGPQLPRVAAGPVCALLVFQRVQLASRPEQLHKHSAPLERALSVVRRRDHGVAEVQPALLHAVGEEGVHVVVDSLRPRQSQH